MIPPTNITPFTDEEDAFAKLKEFGVLDKSRKSPKKTFVYKGIHTEEPIACRAIGFQSPFELVIEFENGNQHVIHPRYLAEMQKKDFDPRRVEEDDQDAEETILPDSI